MPEYGVNTSQHPNPFVYEGTVITLLNDLWNHIDLLVKTIAMAFASLVLKCDFLFLQTISFLRSAMGLRVYSMYQTCLSEGETKCD